MQNRITTSLIFGIIVLGGILLGQLTFSLLFLLITGMCLWEYLSIVFLRERRRDYLRQLVGLGLGLVPFILLALQRFHLVPKDAEFFYLAALFMLVFFSLLFLFELYANSARPFENVATIMLGVLYIGFPFSLLNVVAYPGGTFSIEIILGLLLMTWANDSFAFLVGSQFGQRLFFPRISPKKTWEGFIGGTVFTVLLALILSRIFGQLPATDWLVISLLISAFSPLGDLVESMLKRSLRLKDSGRLLPGHGGVLDRFDGFIFLLPFVTLYLQLSNG